MKPLILITSIFVALFSGIWITYGANEFDIYAEFIAARDGFSDAVSCVGNSFISMGTVMNYSGLRTIRHLFNVEFALNYRDAEYFFRKEQKARDRRVESLKRGQRRSVTYFGKTFTKGKI